MENYTNIIEFKDITVTFPGVLAVDNVNLSIKKGEIHAIVGENGAGKSTLMNVLGGEVHPSSGTVIYKGRNTTIPNPLFALENGISIVFQELKLCPNLNVLENIYLGREKKNKIGMVNLSQMSVKAKEHLLSLGLDINIKSKVDELTIGQQQLVEIAKAISLNSDVLILDEPTSSLTYNETERLFNILNVLKNKGVTIIFISHRLEEVFRISDRISVLRDGKYLGTFESKKISIDNVVDLIAGKELSEELSRIQRKKVERNRVALEVKGLSRGRLFKNINLKLYEGEILGIYGLQGSGRTELIETIFGMEKPDSGAIYVFGKKARINNVRKALSHGLSMVPEDRRRTGLFSNMDVKDNICSAFTEKLNIFGIMINRRMIGISKNSVEKLSIKVSGINQMVKNLSGGNQQKVIIARWLARYPKILLMDELTRGIDVGAKAEIYRILRNLQSEGISVVMISSELSEIIAESNRVLVMRNGEIKAELMDEKITKENILSFAMKDAVDNPV